MCFILKVLRFPIDVMVGIAIGVYGISLLIYEMFRAFKEFKGE